MVSTKGVANAERGVEGDGQSTTNRALADAAPIGSRVTPAITIDLRQFGGQPEPPADRWRWRPVAA